MTTDVSSHESLPFRGGVLTVRSIASAWRRFAAYVIDGLFLGFLGSVAGRALFDPLSQMGAWGRLVGFCAALIYFAVLDSTIGMGQTFGKRWLGLRVLDTQGRTISLSKSILRSMAFLVPVFLYGIRLPETRTSWIISSLIFVVVVWIGGSTAYLVTFDHRTRQGIHDLVGESYVANAHETGPLCTAPMPKSFWATLGTLLIIASLFAGTMSVMLARIPPNPQMWKDARLIEQVQGVQRAHLRGLLLHGPDGTVKKSLVASIIVRPKSLYQTTFADEVARMILNNDPNALSYDELSIRLFYGYDIGIFNRWDHLDFARPPAEWRQHLLTASSPH